MRRSAPRQLLWVGGLWSLGNSMASMFMSIYLWRLRPGVSTPAVFTLWQSATIMVVFPLLGFVVKRRGAALVNLLGMAAYALYYLLLLAIGARAVNYLPGLGLFMGAAVSAQAIAWHVLAYDTTDPATRERFYGRYGVITSLTGLLAPLAAGWLVSAFHGLLGYQIMFVLSCALFTAAAWVGLALRAQHPPAPYRLGSVFTRPHAGWRRLLLAYVFIGLQNGLFSFAVNLLVYLAASKESGLGNYAFLTGLVGLGAFWVAGRITTTANRRQIFALGAWLAAAACGILALGVSWLTLLAYGLLNAVANALWQTTLAPANFAIIQEASGSEDLRVEMIAGREIPLGLGRVGALALFLTLVQHQNSTLLLRTMLAVLGLAFPLAWFLLTRRSRT